MNIKKIVQFTTHTHICIFGCTDMKIVRFTTCNSVIHNFRARSSEILFLHNSQFTRRFQERNPTYN